MKRVSTYVVSALAGGLVIVLPIYLSVLLLLKLMGSVGHLVKPVAKLVPEWLPAERLLSLVLVLIVCFLIGAVARTPAGKAVRDRIEKSVFERLPGYALFRSFTQQLSGTSQERIWKPALVEIEEALVPAFIIEEFDDGRFTVFVPAAPTPFTGSVYILTPERVHLLDVSITKTIKSLSRWGHGSKELVAAMKTESSFLKKRVS